MLCQLHWTIDPNMSCYHAVEIVLRGWPLADAALKAALAAPIQNLKGVLEGDHLIPLAFTEHLVPLSHGAEGCVELALTVLRKLAGRDFAENRHRRYADLLEPILNVWRNELPRLDERWPIRGEWLQGQWTEHETGLLTAVTNWTEHRFILPEAEVFLVHPLTGGGGAAHLRYRSARLESITENLDAKLPEVVRLAWLVSALNLVMPRYTDRFPTVQRCLAVGLRAMIPVALTAAQELKLAALDNATLESAVQMWLPDPEVGLAANLLQWWEVYRDTRPKWPLALAALDRVLGK